MSAAVPNHTYLPDAIVGCFHIHKCTSATVGVPYIMADPKQWPICAIQWPKLVLRIRLLPEREKFFIVYSVVE